MGFETQESLKFVGFNLSLNFKAVKEGNTK